MKILYLDTNTDETNDYIRKQRMKKKGCDSFCIYNTKKRTLWFKAIQFLGIYLYAPILYFIYGEWKHKIDEYDLFIVTSRKSCKYALKYIKKRTDKRVIVWYWNLITKKEINPKYCKKIGCETWTFDLNDAHRFDMKFNDTYYFPEDDKIILDTKNEYDIFYVGINKKGREKQLIKIANYCDIQKIKYKIVLVGSTYSKFQTDRLNYEQVVKFIYKSKAILDLNIKNQTGMTLRPLESLFYNKKLITNNNSIVKYVGYVKDNTYILNNEEYEGLDGFLNKEIVKIDDRKKTFYLYESWLNRIINNVEANHL